MAYSFFLEGTPEVREIALVRDEIDDVAEAENPASGTDYFVSDERIISRMATTREEAASDANDAEIRLMACASILDTLATNQAYVLKKQRTMSEETDGPAVAVSIRAHAKSCRDRAINSLRDRRKLAAEAAARAFRLGEPQAGGFAVVTRF